MHRLRVTATVAICLTLATVGCGEDDGSSSNPETTSPTTEAIGPSTPSTAGSEPTLSTSGPRVPPVGAYGAGWSEIGAGIGYLELVADGTGRVLSLGVDLAGPREDRFTFEVAGDRLTVTSGADGAWGCNEGQPGIYEWALAGTRLELDAMDEPCAQRATAIQLDWGGDWSWYSLGDAPIVETGLGDAPVAVDTPIGTIEWTARTPRPSEPHILPESNLSFEMMTPPSGGPVERVEVWTLESGFLMRDAHGTYWTSPDHSQWAEATGAPSDLTIEATFGDAVYGTVGRHEDVTSTDGGHTWQAADRPGGAGDLFAVGDVGLVAVESAIFGPCVGVVFVSADGTTWQRALNPWPPPAMGQPTIVGDSIVIPAGDCGGNAGQIEWIRVGQIEWIGTIR